MVSEMCIRDRSRRSPSQRRLDPIAALYLAILTKRTWAKRMQLLTAHLTRFLCLLGICLSAQAKVSLPNIFGDYMVLQREQANPVWGKASPGEKVSVSIGGQSHTTTTAIDGSWRVTLEPLEVGGPYELEIRGHNTLTFSDILVGEVWICSGQSNMGWTCLLYTSPSPRAS